MDFIQWLLTFAAGAFVVGLLVGAVCKGRPLGGVALFATTVTILMFQFVPWREFGNPIKGEDPFLGEPPAASLVWLGVYLFYSIGFAAASVVGYFLGGILRKKANRRSQAEAGTWNER